MSLLNKGSTRMLSNMEFSCIHVAAEKNLRQQLLSNASDKLSEVLS